MESIKNTDKKITEFKKIKIAGREWLRNKETQELFTLEQIKKLRIDFTINQACSSK